VKLLGHKNEWYVQMARRELAKRRDPEVILPLRTLVLESADEQLALEALWALYVSGGLSEQFADRLLGHANPDVRRWTVRLLGDEGRLESFQGLRLMEIAGYEEDVRVRAQLACTAKRLASMQALPIIEKLLEHGEDANDPFVPLLLWWAVERHAIAARGPIVAMFTRSGAWQRALARDTIIERLVRRYAAEGTPEGEVACARLLAAAPAEVRGRLFAALDAGFKDRSSSAGGSAGTLFAEVASRDRTDERIDGTLKVSPQLAEQIDRAFAGGTSDVTVIRLAARLGRREAQQWPIDVALQRATPEAIRLQAIGMLAEVGSAGAVEPLLKLLADGEPPAIQAAAVDALARFDDERIPAALLKRLPTLDAAQKARSCDVLLARKDWAGKLLAQVDRGEISPKDISLDQLRVVALHKDAGLDAVVKKHWGTITSGTPEARLAEMRRISNDLRAAAGDAGAGKALFAKHCGTCHRLFGEGNEIGPELTHANRQNTAELLATIVDPSAIVRREYQNFLVQTSDGRVLTGLLVAQSPGGVTLLGAKNERTEIARDEIETLAESPTSLMPENILGPLQPQELRDLFAYLQSGDKERQKAEGKRQK
jgi:putative heme-binding domain-containing protein